MPTEITTMLVKSALIFAAGFGSRLGVLTKLTPKPLIQIGNRALIDHTLNLIQDVPLKIIVVNAHYHAEKLINHLKKWPLVKISLETPDILETGGGLKQALPLLAANSVFTLNSDTIFIDTKHKNKNPLCILQNAWQPQYMDALLLLVARSTTGDFQQKGDFLLQKYTNNLAKKAIPIQRARGNSAASYLYTGIQIIKTDFIKNITQRQFSLNYVWDIMIEKKRIYGCIYPGHCFDIGTLKALDYVRNNWDKNKLNITSI